jgi:hypothetical protein
MPFHLFLRRWLATLVVTSIVSQGFSQSSPDAGNWKTYFVASNEITVAAVPGKDQTQRELIAVKEKLSKNDAKALEQVKYWDAGSPAYRWNEMASNLVTMRDFPTFLRTPTAWMNMAIFDATAAAWKLKYNFRRWTLQ